MTHWECTIAGDPPHTFDHVEDLLVHQATEHDRVECAVCGALVPDGYFALRHMFDEHSRREYLDAYDVSSEAVHEREEIRERIEREADLQDVVERIEGTER